MAKTEGTVPARLTPSFRCALAWVLFFTFTLGAAAQTVVQHFHNPAHGTAWSAWLREQISRFEAQNPGIKVELIIPASSVSADQFLTMMASGTSIDVSELVLRLAASVAAQGVYTDLRPYLERSAVLSLDDFAPVARQAVTRHDGVVWGVPVDLYVVPTHYNADMFIAGGLATPAELGTAWTFEAALEAAKRLTVDRNGDGVNEEWGTHNAYTLWVYRNAFENRGAEWFDRDIEPTESRLASPEVIEALQWVADLHLVHNVTDLSSGSYSAELPKGIYAWSLGTGPNTANLLSQAQASFRWGVALPIGGVRQGAYTAVNSFQIPRTSQNPDAAFRWIEFLLGSVESWQSFMSGTGRLPARTQVMPMWLEMIERLPNAPEGAHYYIESAMHPDNYLDILSPHYARFDSLAFPLVNAVIRGERSAQSAMEELHQLMTAIFNE